MGHSVRVQVESSSDRVMFGLSDISGHFGLGRVLFGSGRFRVNQFLVKYACHAKTSNFVENFGSGFIRLWIGLLRVFESKLVHPIPSFGSGTDPGRSVRVSGPG